MEPASESSCASTGRKPHAIPPHPMPSLTTSRRKPVQGLAQQDAVQVGYVPGQHVPGLCALGGDEPSGRSEDHLGGRDRAIEAQLDSRNVPLRDPPLLDGGGSSGACREIAKPRPRHPAVASERLCPTAADQPLALGRDIYATTAKRRLERIFVAEDMNASALMEGQRTPWRSTSEPSR